MWVAMWDCYLWSECETNFDFSAVFFVFHNTVNSWRDASFCINCFQRNPAKPEALDWNKTLQTLKLDPKTSPKLQTARGRQTSVTVHGLSSLCRCRRDWSSYNLQDVSTYVASPTKSSFVPSSLSRSLINSSVAPSETVNTKVSFYLGSHPLPAVHKQIKLQIALNLRQGQSKLTNWQGSQGWRIHKVQNHM